VGIFLQQLKVLIKLNCILSKYKYAPNINDSSSMPIKAPGTLTMIVWVLHGHLGYILVNTESCKEQHISMGFWKLAV